MTFDEFKQQSLFQPETTQSFDDFKANNATTGPASFDDFKKKLTIEQDTPDVVEFASVPRFADFSGNTADTKLNTAIQRKKELEQVLFSREKELEKISSKSALSKISNVVTYPMWAGIKTLGWLASRIEYPLATVATKVLEGMPSSRRWSHDVPTKEENLEDIKRIGKSFGELPSALKASLSTWIPGRPIPKEVRDFTAFFATYTNTMSGPASSVGTLPKEAPVSAVIGGAGASMLVPIPGIGKTAKAVRKVGGLAKTLIGVPERIPLWDVLKIGENGEKMAHLNRVAESAEAVTPKNLQVLADELNKKLGTNFSAKTIGVRLSQLSGRTGQAGITTFPELEKVANPIIDELQANHKELIRLGMMPADTYVSKLTKAEEAVLQAKKTDIRRKIDKLSEAPYKTQLLKMVSNIDLPANSREVISNKLLTLGEAIEDGGPELSERLAQVLELPVASESKFINLLSRIEKADRKSRISEINILLDEASKVEGLQLKGVIPTIKYITNMKRNFPGKADKIRSYLDEIDDINKQLYKSEIYGGAPYFPHVFEKKKPSLLKRLFGTGAKPKIGPQEYLKGRELFKPEEVRAAGIMESISYPAVKRLVETTNDIHAAQLFEKVAKNNLWTSDKPLKGFELMPKTERWGALAGKYVTKRVYNDLISTYGPKSDLGITYDTMLGIWKGMKVSLSPAVQAHNLGGNTIQLYASGMSSQDIVVAAQKTHAAWKGNTAEWQNVQKYIWQNTALQEDVFGSIVGNFSKEQEGLMGLVQKMGGLNQTVLKYPSKVWTNSEKIFKTFKYMDSRAKGMDVLDSVREAQKWLIDYSDLQPFEKSVMRRIVPFYTFTSRSMPLMLEALEKRPTSVLPFVTLPYTVTKMSLHTLEMNDQDWDDLQKDLPDYMQNGNYMLMPFRDANGDLRLWDWSSFLPWNVFDDMQERGVLSPVLSNPLVQITYDIQINRNSFNGQPIVPQIDIDLVKKDPEHNLELRKQNTIKQMAYMWNIIAPRLAGTNFWGKMWDAGMGKTPRGKKVLLPETFAQEVLGVRTVPVDIELNHQMKTLEKNSLNKDVLKKLRSLSRKLNEGSITEEEFDKEYQLYTETLSRIGEEE